VLPQTAGQVQGKIGGGVAPIGGQPWERFEGKRLQTTEAGGLGKGDDIEVTKSFGVIPFNVSEFANDPSEEFEDNTPTTK
jgi:hypothetical protein